MASSKWQGCVEAKIMAPLEGVWKIASDYYGLLKWFSAMKSCERVEGAPEKGVGSVRRCIASLPSGRDSVVVEELIAQDDVNHSFTFRINDIDVPGFVGYEATFEFCETGEPGNCLMKWSFEVNPIEGGSKEEIEALRGSVLPGMISNLEQLASSQ